MIMTKPGHKFTPQVRAYMIMRGVEPTTIDAMEMMVTGGWTLLGAAQTLVRVQNLGDDPIAHAEKMINLRMALKKAQL